MRRDADSGAMRTASEMATRTASEMATRVDLGDDMAARTLTMRVAEGDAVYGEHYAVCCAAATARNAAKPSLREVYGLEGAAVAMLGEKLCKERSLLLLRVIHSVAFAPLWFTVTGGPRRWKGDAELNHVVKMALAVHSENGWHVRAWAGRSGVDSGISTLIHYILQLDAGSEATWWATEELNKMCGEIASASGNSLEDIGHSIFHLASFGDVATRYIYSQLPRRVASLLCNQRGTSNAASRPSSVDGGACSAEEAEAANDNRILAFDRFWVNADIEIREDECLKASQDGPWRVYVCELQYGRTRILMVRDGRPAVGGKHTADYSYFEALAGLIQALAETGEFYLVDPKYPRHSLSRTLGSLAAADGSILRSSLVDLTRVLDVDSHRGAANTWPEWEPPLLGETVPGRVRVPVLPWPLDGPPRHRRL